MKLLTKTLADGWAVRIWPHYKGFTVVLTRGDGEERIGRSGTIKAALKAALR